MATTTATLTINSTDLLTDELSLSTTCTLTQTGTNTGVFGINIHRATALEGKTSTYVNKWSAGCQVIASNDDWMEFLSICQEAREHWGNSFSYTLIESKNIK